jgi:hypothetical protein
MTTAEKQQELIDLITETIPQFDGKKEIAKYSREIFKNNGSA